MAERPIYILNVECPQHLNIVEICSFGAGCLSEHGKEKKSKFLPIPVPEVSRLQMVQLIQLYYFYYIIYYIYIIYIYIIILQLSDCRTK